MLLDIFRTFPASSAAPRWLVNTSPVSCQPLAAASRTQDRVGRAGLDAADPAHDDRVIGHLPDDAEIMGTNKRSWFC
jgi:hypothetical protein